jgi:glutathione S-transferase
MRLYHINPSRSTRVLWMLEEIGAPYELELLTWEDRDSDEHRKRHPLGRIPVIEEEGGFVFESAAICLHLADLHPEARLIAPIGSHERALQYQWSVFAMTELESPGGEVRANRESNPEAAAAAGERWRTAATVVGDALGGNDFIVGNRFSVADLLLGAVLSVGKRLELTDGMPAVQAYIERLEQRPARERANAIPAAA